MKSKLFFLLLLINCISLSAQQSRILTTDDGLTSSLILSMYQDSEGLIWIGTENGLNCYDGLSLRAFKTDRNRPGSICSNIVRTIVEDGEGHLVIGTGSGIQLYDRHSGTFSEPLCFEDGTPLKENVNRIILRRNGELLASGNKMVKIIFHNRRDAFVSDSGIPEELSNSMNILEDSSENIWATKYGEGIVRYSPNGTVTHYTPGDSKEVFISAISEGPGGTIYAGTNRNGLYCYIPESDSFVSTGISEIEGTIINTIYNLGNGMMCIGTDSRGAMIGRYGAHRLFKLETGDCPYDPDKLKIHDIIKDSEGNIWLGAYQKGVMMVPQSSNNFTYIGSRSVNADLIGTCCVTALTVGQDRSLWVGTDNDGIYRIGVTRRFPGKGNVTHYPAGVNGITETVMDIAEDSDGYIWFGTYTAGLHRLDPTTGNAIGSSALTGWDDSNLNVYAIAEDSSKRLWTGTMGYGLFYIDLKTMTINSLRDLNNNINLWLCDIIVEDDNLFASSFDGLYRIDISEQSPRVVNHWLEDRICYSSHKDGDLLYVGTSDGMYVLNLSDGSDRLYTKSDGLPDNTIYNILDGNDGRKWISTSYGLSSFSPEEDLFNNYYAGDGLQSNEFTRAAAAEDKANGALFFGGTHGITWFFPDRITEAARLWNVRITAIRTPEREIYPTGNDKVELKCSENTATIQFCTAEYGAPDGVLYSYSIDGSGWTTLSGGDHSITLNGLKPGNCMVRVKAIDNGIESFPTEVRIVVRHAWWNSVPAMAIYLLALLLTAVATVHTVKKRAAEKKEMERHLQAEEASASKLRSFVNLSHEIRTPMTLIDGPLQSLMESDGNAERQKSYATMKKNVRRILGLINQMLDVQKIDSGQLRLKFRETDLNSLVEEICTLFRGQAERKKIKLDFRYSGSKELPVWLDRHQFDKVIVNLLSNSIKYTPEGGKVTVLTGCNDGKAVITVTDNGRGLNPGDMDKVFDLFYQAGDQPSGTGIGLNLTRTLVQMHHGTIRASNNAEGGGCTFTVEIPLGNAHLKAEDLSNEVPDGQPATEAVGETVTGPSGNVHEHASSRKRVLVVEDDDDIRDYLKTKLSKWFYTDVCSNGKDALERILKKAPDLVISDVIMPEMDGYTLCRKIRRNITINSLPVILLTAKAGDSERIEGLDAGADAYIAKPFNMEVLGKTALSLINSREKLKVAYNEKQTVNVSKVETADIKSPDEKLMERVNKVINENIGNPGLTVEQIAAEVGISRVHLYRKLTQLTNQTTRDYIKNLRLNKAAEMLSEKKHAISEVSEAVGFSSPANFATAFKELFGVSPSEYRAEKKPSIT